ncbi:hypothetical protein [Georgenia yuyongxinii]|uniref:Uncharacterized protein n=1 Tax=Georgenia yuyongxinii TaxID=2589797 RepID=A0A552WUM8_9MICO|nr:hypothetical protein [Georgenia yuyongxinii]TRW46395.1 hypothetical protein FJ693_05565 [Georgenia yuyongxinii]
MGHNQVARIMKAPYYAAREAETEVSIAKNEVRQARANGDPEAIRAALVNEAAAKAARSTPGPWGILTSTQRMVLWAIVIWADEAIEEGRTLDNPGGSWSCQISRTTIMVVTGLGKTAVDTAVNDLIRLGFLRVESGKEAGRTNMWTVVDMVDGPIRPPEPRNGRRRGRRRPRSSGEQNADPAPTPATAYVETETVVDAELVEEPSPLPRQSRADDEFEELFGEAVGGL